MFIKTLTIQGFKSYHDQTQIESFSPKHNVVVGRNGSGKSNFFAAIRFVLSDAYTSMSREERQSLLHEGVSIATTLSAFVEIIFDNSDGRFPTGKDETILRRTIGLKKDEYSLDKKSVSKADVMNLLESAGFSRANPYYIVPQGRITALTNAKDHERLTLLKEVAGTKVYEQRRTESLRIMFDTTAKRSKISELLEYIDGRLAELEEEKDELKEWTEKDRERRCLEYTLYSRELEEISEALVELEEERMRELDSAKGRRDAFADREKEIRTMELKISEYKAQVSTLQLARLGNQSELAELTAARTELACTVADLDAASSRAGGTRDNLRFELASITRQISTRERDLQDLMPGWDALRAREGEAKRALDVAQGRLEALYSKQGRLNRFKSKAERDKFLNGEIASLQAFRNAQIQALDRARVELQRARASADEISERSAAARREAEEAREAGRKATEQVAIAKDTQAERTERRKALWREDTKLGNLVSHAYDEFRKADSALAGMMDRDTGSALRAVEQLMDRPGFEGVYGPLYRLFNVENEEYNLAVEITAGTSLFHVVVDTDQTASKVLDLLNHEKTGRITFMPLNRLKPKNPTLPTTAEAFPLLDKLRYEQIHAPAMQQVFGRTCVCKDLLIGAAYVKSHGINTITLDGDRVDRKGALTGGYHDVRRSRLDAIKAATHWRARHEEEDRKAREVKAAMQKLDQEITRASGEIQIAMATQARERTKRDARIEEERALQREAERVRERIAKLETDIEEAEAEVRGLDAKLQSLDTEKASPLAKGLSSAEEQNLENLGKEVDGLQKQLIEIGKEKAELGSQKNEIEIDLHDNLCRRRGELELKIENLGESRVGDDAAANDLQSKTRELKSINASIDALNKRNRDMDKEVDKLTAALQDLRVSLEQIQTQQTEDSRGINKQQKMTERFHTLRNTFLNRKEECNRSIRDLGVLPEEAFDKYTNEKGDKLLRKLHAVNEALKKFAHVNKKAFEQYANFTKQRDQLLERRSDLDASAQKIEDLVEVLDQRKDEAIERTFKQVASNFEEVFEQLVPAGKGRLIIQRRIDQDQDADEQEDTQQTTVDSYTGVAIKVSFNSKVDEGLRIQQLSGGQKSLVALALVFSIQKCDPAPFYLFDEIDANLDAQYRTAVANMIHSLSQNAQFITTTFRPEMLVTADKFYGVLFSSDKISSIRSIKREEAQGFVDQEAQAQ